MEAVTFDPENVWLVYEDSNGEEWTQPVSDLHESGTLCDPETGEDMVVVSVRCGVSEDNVASWRLGALG